MENGLDQYDVLVDVLLERQKKNNKKNKTKKKKKMGYCENYSFPSLC